MTTQQLKQQQQQEYARTLYQWIAKDDRALRDGIEKGLDVFAIASSLSREPTSVLRRLSDADIFQFEDDSDEQIELFALALGGVPVGEVVLWCSADLRRKTLGAIEAMRKGPDLREILCLAREHHVWGINAGALDELQWLAMQLPSTIAEAAKAISARVDAVTPKTLKDHLCGVVSDIQVAAPAWRRKRSKSMSGSTPPRSRSATHAKTGSGPYRERRRSSGGKKKSSPVLFVDCRTAAERAWEDKISWD